MRIAVLSLFLVALLSSTLSAQDQLVRAALKRIEQYEALEPGLEPGDVATANRYLNALRFAAKRLNAAYKKDTVHWKDASKRYNALVAKITAKAKSKTSAEESSDAPKSDAPAKGDTPAGPPSGVTRKVNPRELQALNNKVQRAYHNLKGYRITDLDDKGRVQRIREQITMFRVQLRGLPPSDASVQTVTKNIDAMQKLLDAGLAKLETMRAPVDAPQKLAKLKEFYKSFDMLQPLRPPLDPKHVEDWARRLREFRDERMPADLRWLDSVKGKVGIPLQEWQRVRGWVSSSWPMKLRGLLAQNMNTIDGPARSAIYWIDATLKLDLEDGTAVANRVLMEGQLERNMKRAEEAKDALEVAAAYHRGLGTETKIDFAKELKRVAQAREHLQKAVRTGLDRVRLPKPATTDAKLTKTAHEVLARKKYGAGKPVRLVINTKVQRKEKREGSITPGTVSARITMYHYVWDEFQVCTVEREGDTHWIWFNTIRFYHKGGSTTPTGHWILSKRFRSTPILEKNL
jgi:hypothetical protein